MNSIKANNFKTRDELETYVKGVTGLTPDIKEDYKITGTSHELKRLQLSSGTIFWGIKIDVTDEDKMARKKVADRVYRGVLHDYGINNKKTK